MDRLEMLARIAGMYYEDNLSQAEIAARTGYSRSMISRLLAEARDEGVVEIRIRYPLERRTDLEPQLQEMLGLTVVRVLLSGTTRYEERLRRLGNLAAHLVEELVYDNMTIGVSWGTGIWETVQALRPGLHAGVRVVQMIGALGTPDPDIDGPELARRLARTVTGRYSTLPAPLFVDSEATRQALMTEPRVLRVIQDFKSIELALVGVGTVDAQRASLLRAGYLTVQQLEELREAGAVGDVCAIHFDIDGNLVDLPLQRRVVGIDAATLAGVPMKLGVAGGQYKSDPIIGASRAGLINMLVTDDIAAMRIMHEFRRDGFHQSLS